MSGWARSWNDEEWQAARWRHAGRPAAPQRPAAPPRPPAEEPTRRLSRRHRHDRRPRAARRLAVASAVLALGLAAHRFIPSLDGLGVGLNSILPWLGMVVPMLWLVAALARSPRGALAAALPAVVWAAMFGPVLAQRPPGGASDLTVASQNVGSTNPDAATAAHDLVGSGAELVAVEKLSGTTGPAVGTVLDPAYPYHEQIGTVGLWSRYPLADVQPEQLDLGWTRAFRAQVDDPLGALEVYVVHLDSIRVGSVTERDRMLHDLAATVDADSSPRLLVIGDFNTATTDPAMGQLVPHLHDSQADAGAGFGFTWPAAFPITRPDHILYRGLTATRAWVMDTPDSPHRAVLASFRITALG